MLRLNCGSVARLLLLSCCATLFSATAQVAVAQDAAIQADLPQALAADSLHEGTAFVLRVSVAWQQGPCHLTPGAVLHGTVHKISRSPSGHVQGVGLLLNAVCGDEQPLDLVVTSLLAPPSVEVVTEQFPGYGSGGGAASAGVPMGAPMNFNAYANERAAPQAFSSATVHVNDLPKTVRLGEVWRLPRVKLTVPTGNSKESLISTTAPSLKLPEKCVFVLQHVRYETHPETAIALAGEHRAVPAPRAIRPFVRPCASGSCTAYGAPQVLASTKQIVPTWEEDLSLFGFKTERDREVLQFEQNATVHFVGNNEVLVTFPTRALVRRTGKERPTDEYMPVRAVLLPLGPAGTKRLLDWTIEDHNAYIWPLGHNLLVHEGPALRIYGPGLQEMASLPLTLPLASLRTSPDGAHVLLGELHELHSAEEHKLLVETDNRGPQEEVLWSLLDGDLHRVRTFGTSSNFMPTPALKDHGLVELRRGKSGEWFLVGKDWEGSKEEQLGALRSDCVPMLDDMPPDLLTIKTCNAWGEGMRVSVVREDGSPVTERVSGNNDLPVYTAGADNSMRIATLISRTNDWYTPGFHFHLSAIKDQIVAVQGATNGSLVTAVPLPSSMPYRSGFALSPDGTRLAVLCGQRLIVYQLPR